MFSLDNFYHILHSNFLNNKDIQSFYFYPFGTTNAENLLELNIVHQTEVLTPRLSKMSVLFYDQEPLPESMSWREKFGSCPQLIMNTKNNIRVLANSEKSVFKDQLCQEQNLQDWYYFFHGLVALDWYRDYQYIKHTQDFETKFLCLNRIVTGDRSYRLELVARLMDKGLTDHGQVSLAISDQADGDWRAEISNPDTKLSTQSIDVINRHITKLTGPLIVDKTLPDSNCSAHVGPDEIALNQSSLWHIVSETVFYYNKHHLTEKIFKPIVSKRPFILVGAPGNLAYLKSYGFKTFDQWIDESYDLETDPSRRIQMIVDQVTKICDLSHAQLEEMQQQMQSTIDYNYNHFFGKFKELVVDEMLTNFSSIVATWNSHCAQGRSIDMNSINFDDVKQKLLC